jgi:hypothetical protein
MHSETDGFIEAKSKHDSTDSVARDVSSQEAPERHPSPELENLERRLKELPETKQFLRKVLRMRIEQVKAEMATGEKENQRATQNSNTPKRWQPPNRPLTVADIRERRAFNKAADEAAKATVHPPSETSALSESADRETLRTVSPQIIEKTANSQTPCTPSSVNAGLGKRHLCVSCIVFTALALFWYSFGSNLQCILVAFPFVVSIVLGGIFSSMGPLGILRSFAPGPKQLERAFRNDEDGNACKKHGRSFCSTCLAWQWNYYRSVGWAVTAALFFLLLGVFVLQERGNSDASAFSLGGLTPFVIYLHVGSGCLILLRVYCEQERMRPFVADEGRPFRMSWGVLKSSDVWTSAIQIAFFASWLVLVTKPLWPLLAMGPLDGTSLDPLKLAVTSMTLYCTATYWLLKSEESYAKLFAAPLPNSK